MRITSLKRKEASLGSLREGNDRQSCIEGAPKEFLK